MSRIQPMGKVRSFVKREKKEVPFTGRFSVGQVLYGVTFSYAGDSMSSTRLPFIYDVEMPEKIHFIELKVMEHHKVPNFWDIEVNKNLIHDGYKLKDSTEVVYHNQFPRASYGQISDTADRLFSIHLENKEEIEKFLDNDKEKPGQFQLATDILERMEKGIVDLSSLDSLEQDHLTRLRISLLKTFVKRFKDEFYKKFNKYIFSVPHPRFRVIRDGYVVDTLDDVYRKMYKPADKKIVGLARQCKKYKVDHKKRILPGLYYRIFFRKGSLHKELIEIKGYVKGKKKQHGSEIKKYAYNYLVENDEKVSGGYYYFATDFARSADVYKYNSKTKELIELLEKAASFDYYVAVSGNVDNVDNFIYMKNIDNLQRWIDEKNDEAFKHWTIDFEDQNN